jgi:hypothetical protein
MTYIKYSPYLSEKQWLEIISNLNDKQKITLRLLSRDKQETFTKEIAEELGITEKQAYLNVIGGITKKVGNLLNLKAGDNRWAIVSQKRCGCISWVMSGVDKIILRRLIRQEKL